jgi:hypothetical protein
MTLLERLAHYARQPGHATSTEPGPDGRTWHTVTDEDGVLIDWFPTEEPASDQPPAQSKRRK